MRQNKATIIIFFFISSLYSNLLYATPKDLNYKLAEAIEYGYEINRIEALLKDGANPNTKFVHNSYRNFSPLIFAIIRNKLDLAEILLKYGGKIDIQDNDLKNAIIDIAGGITSVNDVKDYLYSLPSIDFLIKNGVPINLTDMEGDSFITSATQRENTPLVAALIDRNIDINHCNNFGNCPLHIAIERNNSELVQLLLKHNSDINIKNSGNQSPLALALRLGNLEIAELLKNKGAKTTLEEILKVSSTNNSDLGIEKFIRDGGEVDNLALDNLIYAGKIKFAAIALEKQKSLPSKPVETNKMIISYLDGPKIEFLGKKKESYNVEFINKLTGEVVFSNTIKNNMWTTSSKKYYIPWQIKVNGLVVDELNLEGKEVLICLESKALGDTLAWAPYSVEFAKKHNCKVILSTFHNKFFEGLESYKDIKFIKPGESHSCYTIYRIGWFKKDGKWGDKDKNPNQVNTIPLQQTVTDILGLDYFEINHGINFKKGNSPLEKPYVIFGPNATSGCKEWDFNHWVTLSKMIKEIGYEVVVLTQKPFYIEGTINVMSGLNVAANYLCHAKAFIGLGSGLSWFNWSLGNHTFMINGFAKPEHEFTTNCTKIYNDNTCIFCWNDEVFMFDSGDWDWCPVYKGTTKQHICQRSITPLQVFNKLKI
jgi:autotransporter strand-loop-strand O-heptosyltransferase